MMKRASVASALLLSCTTTTPPREDVVTTVIVDAPVDAGTPEAAVLEPAVRVSATAAAGDYTVVFHHAGGDCTEVPERMHGIIYVTSPAPNRLSMWIRGFASPCEGTYAREEFVVENCTLDFADGPNRVDAKWVFAPGGETASPSFDGTLSVIGGSPVCTTLFTVSGVK